MPKGQAQQDSHQPRRRNSVAVQDASGSANVVPTTVGIGALPLTTCPVIKPTCELFAEDAALCVRNGPFEIRIGSSTALADRMLDAITERPLRPDSLAESLAEIIGGTLDDGREAVAALIRVGAVVEHPELRPSVVNGEYLGYRLTDTFRQRAHDIWGRNTLLRALGRGNQRSLAIGFLLESYYVIREANWTAAAVLGQAMTGNQRRELEEFFHEEAEHSELMADAFATVGLDPHTVRRGIATPESRLYNQFFFGCGHLSPAHFAASIIVPEVRELPPGTGYKSGASPRLITDVIENDHGVPKELLDSFRAHEDIDDEADHGFVPVLLLAEYGYISRELAAELFSILELGIHSFNEFLNGIERRYADWDGKVILDYPGAW
jgi:hypothetical protein